MAVEYYSDDEYMAYFRGLETDGVFEFTGDPTFSTDYDWIIVKKSLAHLLKAWENDNTCLEYWSGNDGWRPTSQYFVPRFHKDLYRIRSCIMIAGIVYKFRDHALNAVNNHFDSIFKLGDNK